MLKKYDEGLQVCEDAVQVHKNADFDKRDRKNLAKIYLKRARIYELQDKLEEAIKEYDSALLEDNDGKIRTA
jgi:stress-induced-phosphoprotein 1